MNEWISVNDEMPSKGEDVQLYCSDTKEQMVGFLVESGQFQFGTYPLSSGFTGALVCQPTHWSPLREPPQ